MGWVNWRVVDAKGLDRLFGKELLPVWEIAETGEFLETVMGEMIV